MALFFETGFRFLLGELKSVFPFGGRSIVISKGFTLKVEISIFGAIEAVR